MRRTLFAGLLLSVCLVGCKEAPEESIPANPAPPIEGMDLNGKLVRLSDYRGKVVVVSFWATWCPPCVEMIPHERSLVQRMQGKPFAMLGISLDDNEAALRSFIQREGITWTNIRNGRDGSIPTPYGVRTIPAFFVIDAHGNLRHQFSSGSGPAIERAVDGLLAKMKV